MVEISNNNRLLAEMFSALGTDRRVDLILAIAKSPSPLTVTQLAQAVSISLGSASHHLKILEQVGLLTRIPSGSFIYYFINQDNVESLLKFITTLQGVSNA